MTVTIYHNPRCAKSRETLRLLRERDIDPTIIEYLDTPPSAAELKTVLKKLGIPARDLLRVKEASYKELGLANPKLTEAQLIDAMVKHPVLIERPIVVNGGKARVGRPPESILDII